MEVNAKSIKEKCEWRKQLSGEFKPSCNYMSNYIAWAGQMYCPFCGKPISFK